MLFLSSTDPEFSMKELLAALSLAAVVGPALAAPQTVTLSVPGMTCAACPITVKKALTKVEGVSQVDVTLEKREAVVTFDDARADTQKLTKATEDAGYPSSVKR
jgi:mercuric ion binding protein